MTPNRSRLHIAGHGGLFVGLVVLVGTRVAACVVGPAPVERDAGAHVLEAVQHGDAGGGLAKELVPPLYGGQHGVGRPRLRQLGAPLIQPRVLAVLLDQLVQVRNVPLAEEGNGGVDKVVVHQHHRAQVLLRAQRGAHFVRHVLVRPHPHLHVLSDHLVAHLGVPLVELVGEHLAQRVVQHAHRRLLPHVALVPGGGRQVHADDDVVEVDHGAVGGLQQQAAVPHDGAGPLAHRVDDRAGMLRTDVVLEGSPVAAVHMQPREPRDRRYVRPRLVRQPLRAQLRLLALDLIERLPRSGPLEVASILGLQVIHDLRVHEHSRQIGLVIDHHFLWF
mmetsp:Transcript_8200/g.16894  ORF Transcript_8200/g.16894 Transcript_8200/m.16894 type:complete len:333 (+) Transcript_8200:551-1549(+)